MKSIQEAIEKAIKSIENDNMGSAQRNLDLTLSEFNEELLALEQLSRVLRRYVNCIEKVRGGLAKNITPSLRRHESEAHGISFGEQKLARYKKKKRMLKELKSIKDELLSDISSLLGKVYKQNYG